MTLEMERGGRGRRQLHPWLCVAMQDMTWGVLRDARHPPPLPPSALRRLGHLLRCAGEEHDGLQRRDANHFVNPTCVGQKMPSGSTSITIAK